MEVDVRGALGAILLVACGTPELVVELDGAPVESGVSVDLGVTRRNVAVPDAVSLVLRNRGRRALEVREVDLPPGVSVVRNDLPIEVGPESLTTLRFGHAARDVGAVDGSVFIETNDGDFELVLSGDVEPYIQQDLQDWPGLTDAVERRLAEDGAVGAAAAVIEGQDIVWMEGFGLQDREQDIAVDPEVTRFRWASLSKGLVAVIAARAVREGAISLDSEVSAVIGDYTVPDRVLPDGCTQESCAETLPDSARVVTLRQLLSHTGGVQHYSNGTSYPVPPRSMTADPEINTGMDWALDLWVDNALVAVPGTTYSYSTFGYNLAGVALEEALDEDLESAVIDRIATPLDMETLAADRGYDPVPDRAAHYTLDGEAIVLDGDDDVSWKLAGGGFTSSVEDLASYCGGLLGTALVDPGLRDGELWVRQENAGSYGLGFVVGDVEIVHTGSQQGSKTALRINPDEGRCYVFMSNSRWVDPGAYTALMRDVAPPPE